MGMLAFAGGATCGACLVYLLDPNQGRRRRALVRDQLIHLGTLARREAPKKSRHLAHRMQGVIAATRSHLEEGMEHGNLAPQGFETLRDRAA